MTSKEELLKFKKDELAEIAITQGKNFEAALDEINRLKILVTDRAGKATYLTEKNLYVTDLLDLVSDTSVLTGLNETQINAKLIKALRVIKYAIKKG